jgi:hypothetical protein
MDMTERADKSQEAIIWRPAKTVAIGVIAILSQNGLGNRLAIAPHREQQSACQRAIAT